MNVSSSESSSRAVVTVPVPDVAPLVIVIDASAPWSSVSAVPGASVSGIVASAPSAAVSVAVTVTPDPSGAGFGDADSVTAGRRATATEYSFVVPSSAVTSMAIVLPVEPSAIAALSWPLDTVVPFTVTDAAVCATVGRTFTCVAAFGAVAA